MTSASSNTPVPPEDSPIERTDTDVARTSRRGLAVTLAAVVLCLALAGGLAIWALAGGDGASGAGEHADHGEHTDHGDHGEEVLAGCDADAYHHTMMMFDPTAADDLLDSGCPWPYDATIELVGGAEDPSIAAAFEPHRYAQVFEIITRERFGMCAVSTLADERVDGFVFGFGVALNPAGCAENVSTVQVDIREYATKAWRDSAANAATAEGVPHVVVLGRWVISIAGDDAEGAARFASLLEPLGGVIV